MRRTPSGPFLFHRCQLMRRRFVGQVGLEAGELRQGYRPRTAGRHVGGVAHSSGSKVCSIKRRAHQQEPLRDAGRVRRGISAVCESPEVRAGGCGVGVTFTWTTRAASRFRTEAGRLLAGKSRKLAAIRHQDQPQPGANAEAGKQLQRRSRIARSGSPPV
jgi:hypothetical protein